MIRRYQHTRSPQDAIRYRTYVLRGIALTLAGLICIKLFYLQVIRHEYYYAQAQNQHQDEIILKAKRGDILVRDKLNGYAYLATDVALNTIFFDPSEIEPADERVIADTLAPLLFEIPVDADANLLEEVERQIDVAREVPDTNVIGAVDPAARSSTGTEIATAVAGVAATPQIQPRESFEKLLEDYKQELIRMMHRKEVDFVLLASNPSAVLAQDVERLDLRGIFVTNEMIYADPTLIREGDQDDIATALSGILNTSHTDLAKSLRRRDIRYIPVKKSVPPDIADTVLAAGLPGVGIVPEYHRYYPEKKLASSILGFINKDGKAQYGVEEQFDDVGADVTLQGVDGHIIIDRDPRGRQIAVGDLVPVPAIDGDSIVLTIDRRVQEEVERMLNKAVEDTRADGGSAIVMNPITGAVIAMANYPGFDPNEYWTALEKYTEGTEAGQYINKVGVRAFKNPVIDEVYEPGSVFKVVTMAAGIDAGEIDTDTVHCQRTAVVYRDNYPIRNSDLKAHGCITMAKVLEKSSNLGALWVAEKLGKTLFHKYVTDFGFGDLTDFDLQQESSGWVRKPHNWADVDLAAASFGQGLAVTPLQMATATAVIANGGKLMRPYIVEEIIDGKTGVETIIMPEIVRQVVSAEAASKVTAMMIGVIEGAYGQKLRIDGYNIAGKSGTAQIASGGGYEKGEGTTITTFIGFAPAENPQFVVLARLERPRSSPWAEGTAAPLWRDIIAFLLNYYGVEPSE